MPRRTPREVREVSPATRGKRAGTTMAEPAAAALLARQATATAKPGPDRSLPPRLRTADRQRLLSPMTIDDLLEPDHPARAVWRFALGLDLSVLYDRIRARGQTAGRPAIDPRILVALWLYATLAGVKSANALADLVIHHDAYFWLAGGIAVNAHTLSDFRVQDADVLERMLEHSVTVLRQQGLIDLDRVAQDGMRARPRQCRGGLVSPPRDVGETAACKRRGPRCSGGNRKQTHRQTRSSPNGRHNSGRPSCGTRKSVSSESNVPCGACQRWRRRRRRRRGQRRRSPSKKRASSGFRRMRRHGYRPRTRTRR